jgi:hypothetical protein
MEIEVLQGAERPLNEEASSADLRVHPSGNDHQAAKGWLCV